MSRRLTSVLVGSALFVAMLASASIAMGERVHRLIEPAPERVPTGLQIDETEWAVVPSRIAVAPDPNGVVSFNIFNRGEDDHDFAVINADGVMEKIDLGPGARGDLATRLTPGVNKIWCNLPGHEALGMVSYINVIDQFDGVYQEWEAEIERLLGPRA